MKNVRLQKQTVLSYSTLFNDYEIVQIEDLLKGVPLTPAIEQIAQLLTMLTNRKVTEVDFHPQNLIGWMMNMSRETQDPILKYLETSNPFNDPNFQLTSKEALLNLLQMLLLHCKGGGIELTKENNGMLFKAMLFMNTLSLKKGEKIFKWNEEGSDDFFFNLILPSKISELGIKRIKDYKIQLIKASYFFEFCVSDIEYNSYLEAFLKYYEFENYREYILSILYPYLLLTTNDESTCKMVVGSDNQRTLDFFNQFVINNKEDLVLDDYKTMREFPLYKSAEDTYIFLFGNFFVDKIYSGFLFDFVSIVGKTVDKPMSFNKLKTDMGNRFSEHKLFYSVMNNCFEKYGHVRKSGEELRAFLLEGEPDYYIRDGNKIFIFELKDVLLRSDVKYSNDTESIIDELSEKLEESKRGRKDKQKKAVKQLFQSIEEVLKGKYQICNLDKFEVDKVQVFPVLVHTDIALESEGVNYFLKSKLDEMIEAEKLPKYRVKDLVLINLDTLIAFQDLFHNRKINLATCLKNYIDYTKRAGPMNRMFPFDEYFKHFISHKKINSSTKSKDFDRVIENLKF